MAKLKFTQKGYKWNYCTVGGVVRVTLGSGEDIAHLDELDQKKWTVLSCPVKGLNMDSRTLDMIDADGDGKIRVAEVVAAAKWLTNIIKDKDTILKGESELSLDNINEQTPEGSDVLKAAKLVLSRIGEEKSSITMADAENGMDIFNASSFNGDGVIVDACTEDAALKTLIANIIATEGAATDKSGADGVNSDTLEKFYADCQAYLSWVKAGEADSKSIFPYAEKTAAAFDACKAVDAKIADYFMRCKLVKFDDAATSAVDVSTAKIEAIGDRNLSECVDQIALYPLARPSAAGVLDLEAVNPAWQAAMDKVVALVGIKENITEASWAAVMASFAPYSAYMASKAGAAVEGLGAEYIASVLSGDGKEALGALITEDLALAPDAAEIASVNKLMHLYRDFYQFLCNYVVFTDLYSRGRRATFEAGELYVDQRCCKLCVEVADMGKHADVAALSGMFLIYCTCTNKNGGKKDIVAVMTDGDITNLRPGKNAIFYDLQGNDWDAVITKIVDNPINIRKAFWSPYRKLSNYISDKIQKSVAGKEAQAQADLLAAADGKKGDKAPFDIAKFAGIFAAIGMAIGFVMSALAGFLNFLGGLSWWQLILLIVAIMLVISGPSCILAWFKLRKRNLGPVLNANGWAINSNVLVNTVYGATLTSVAKYPVTKGKDPFKKETPKWKVALRWTIITLVAIFAALYFTNCLAPVGLEYHKGKIIESVRSISENVAVDLQQSVENAVQEAAEEINAEIK